MSKWRLHSICPACGEGKKSYWYHSPGSCCASNGWIFIWDNLDLSCDECGMSSAHFITHWRFKCGAHKDSHDGYKEADVMTVMNAIGMLADEDIPGEVRKKMLKTLSSKL